MKNLRLYNVDILGKFLKDLALNKKYKIQQKKIILKYVKMTFNDL